MKIEYLSEHLVFTEIVSQWLYDEFFNGIRLGYSYENVKSLVCDCYKNKLPIRLIAIVDNHCAGTVSIVNNDLKNRPYTPWLASLYVDKSFRKNKIGELLVDRAKDIANNLGYSELYLRTEFASNYYRKLGWQFVESCVDEFGLRPDVFKITTI